MRAAMGLKDGASSREKRNLRGTGGWPGLRLFSRLQWRDRGRFARPSPLPLPAKMKDECMPGLRGSQLRRERRAFPCPSLRSDWDALKHAPTTADAHISDSSSWACVFRPEHGGLLGNPRV